MPARLRLAARGRSRRLLAPSPLASFRSPPRCGVVMQTHRTLRHQATERRRPTLADSLPPAPAEPARLPQASCGSRAGCCGKPRKTKRLMAAACAAAMMCLRQTRKSQHGGSVSGGKSARRGVRVKVVLNRPKMLSKKHVASIG